MKKAKNAKKANLWILCEAFTLTGDPDRNNDDYCRYNYSADDREVAWQVYSTEVRV